MRTYSPDDPRAPARCDLVIPVLVGLRSPLQSICSGSSHIDAAGGGVEDSSMSMVRYDAGFSDHAGKVFWNSVISGQVIGTSGDGVRELVSVPGADSQ